jgi:hypothetical protein
VAIHDFLCLAKTCAKLESRSVIIWAIVSLTQAIPPYRNHPRQSSRALTATTLTDPSILCASDAKASPRAAGSARFSDTT